MHVSLAFQTSMDLGTVFMSPMDVLTDRDLTPGKKHRLSQKGMCKHIYSSDSSLVGVHLVGVCCEYPPHSRNGTFTLGVRGWHAASCHYPT